MKSGDLFDKASFPALPSGVDPKLKEFYEWLFRFADSVEQEFVRISKKTEG